MHRFPIGMVVAASLVSCAAEHPSPASPAIDLRGVYERTDRDFDSAVLFRPDDAAADLPAFTLAPLIVIQNGAPGRPAPDVTYARTDDGWTYVWTDPLSGLNQGIHLTVGTDGFPLAAEVMRDSSGARLLFVDTSLEERAEKQFGLPLPDRRYAIERSIDETPDVAVGGVFEPGATPLGPFVYLWEQTHDVNVVLCRCMPPRVFDIVDSIGYTLKPGEAPGFDPLILEPALRLAPGH